jgi:tellurite resistance protein TerC
MPFRQALLWSTFWVALALVFNVGVYLKLGSASAASFLAGYLVELSLSVDNLFVFIMIFEAFKTSARDQRKILTWGLISAVIFRIIVIVAGIQLTERFEWLLDVLGAFLIYAGIKMALQKEATKKSVKEGITVQLLQKIFRSRFLLVLAIVEATDLIFAMDSLPAVIAVTRDSFIVITSNVFAILGLRSLYFMLTGIMGYLKYLRYGVSVVLVFVGFKMLLAAYVAIPVSVTLTVIVGVLGLSILLSLRR